MGRCYTACPQQRNQCLLPDNLRNGFRIELAFIKEGLKVQVGVRSQSQNVNRIPLRSPHR